MTPRRRQKDPVWLPLISEGCRVATELPAGCRLALPVEATDAFPEDLLSHLADILARNPLEISKLDFEFTESSLAVDSEILIYSLAALRDAGAGLVLSGFGMGLTSLSLLRDRSFSGLLTAVKLDRHLFYHEDPAHLQAGQSIARAVVQLASDFGLDTRADGVDTPETLHFLQAIGCQEGRGNSLGKPQPLLDFLKNSGPVRSDTKKRKRRS
jgi:EAL domain-containing protein (putative c-di-GMP-specific phosphodiesterase class I)